MNKKIFYVMLKLGDEKINKHYFETEEKALEYRDNWVKRNKYSKKSIYAIGPLPTIFREGMVLE